MARPVVGLAVAQRHGDARFACRSPPRNRRTPPPTEVNAVPSEHCDLRKSSRLIRRQSFTNRTQPPWSPRWLQAKTSHPPTGHLTIGGLLRSAVLISWWYFLHYLANVRLFEAASANTLTRHPCPALTSQCFRPGSLGMVLANPANSKTD
jgi:hypothetical protein